MWPHFFGPPCNRPDAINVADRPPGRRRRTWRCPWRDGRRTGDRPSRRCPSWWTLRARRTATPRPVPPSPAGSAAPRRTYSRAASRWRYVIARRADDRLAWNHEWITVTPSWPVHQGQVHRISKRTNCSGRWTLLRVLSPYHTIPYSFNNVADMIRNLQQYCSI